MRNPLVCLASLVVTMTVLGPTSHAATVHEAADEALYLKRFQQLTAAFQTGLGLELYDPLEPVPGAARHRPLPAASDAERTVSPEALERARAYAERNNSIALIVWRKGRIEAAHYFKGHDASRTFASRSLAKPMTAVAVGRAIALGHIRSLEQPVADFVTEWKSDPRRSKIRVRNLLDMRSGFLPQANATTAEDILNRAYLHPRHEQIIIEEYPVVDEPGTQYEYNNATSEMVAVLIERATGQRYGRFLSEQVLKPLGAAGGDIWVNRPGGVAHSGCCLMIPPESWVRLGVLVMQDGVWEGRRLLPEGYVRSMQTGTAQNPYYGLGVYVSGLYTPRRGFARRERIPEALQVLHSEPYEASDLFLFDGNSNQVVYVVPSQQLVVLRVGDAPPRKAGEEWDNTFLPNLLIRGIVRDRGVSSRQPTTQVAAVQ
jgi:CubicO group peptidase (beta-lactamase class C family)